MANERLRPADNRKAYDAANSGYGKHTYERIDPSTINVEGFASHLNGEEQHFGDVRQYNSGYNEKHPENDLDIDWLGRIGTVFQTDAEGYEGIWQVVNHPVIKSPEVFCRAVLVEGVDDTTEGKEVITIPCVALGSAVNKENLFEQVVSKVLRKGAVNRKQRVKLTKRT